MESFEVSSQAAEAAAGLSRVVVPTDESGEACARARAAAMQLAVEHGFEVTLYDRSGERWTDTPHPEGPIGVEQVDSEKRSHLVAQMNEFATAGVAVSAFLPTVPAITAIIDAFEGDGAADGLLMPEKLSHPTMMDRLQSSHGSAAGLVEHMLERNLDPMPIVMVVPDSGPVMVVHGA